MVNDNDLRVKRTRQLLRQAFCQLVAEGDINRITVKALTERAGVNRKTFYLHYETIDDFYDEIMTEIMDDFFENHETTPNEPKDLDGHARRFFLFMAGQPPYIEKLVCSPEYYDFGERIYRSQMHRYRSVGGDPFGWMPPEEEEGLVLPFIRNTALDFYRSWVGEGKKVAPQRAADILAELTCNGAGRLMR
ncbi:TetR/AcrR family transcriptional regulator [Parvibacter caecicola]|nr:TetR/AcrR family transcriptional regulator [Parvibacter caecicola]MCR2041069.1 TetR/AcrR family transcriptional regulator [Parvibacter caecicola]